MGMRSAAVRGRSVATIHARQIEALEALGGTRRRSSSAAPHRELSAALAERDRAEAEKRAARDLRRAPTSAR